MRTVSKAPGEIVISRSPSLLTYGYFFHLHWTEKEKGTEVVLCIQPKLVSIPKDRKAIGHNFAEALELEDVG